MWWHYFGFFSSKSYWEHFITISDAPSILQYSLWLVCVCQFQHTYWCKFYASSLSVFKLYHTKLYKSPVVFKERKKRRRFPTFCNHCVLFSIVLSRCCSFWADHSPSTGGESLCTTLPPLRVLLYCSVCDGHPPPGHPSSSGRMKV